MPTVFFRFEPDLNIFLPARRRGVEFSHNFEGHESIKDVIESLGVPHTEVEAILVNKQMVDFNYLIQADDRVEVYGRDSSLPPNQLLVPLRPPLPVKLRFVLDIHLGQLANYLRMFGFDTLYRNDYPDEELAEISSTQDRLLLTRDIGLLKRSIVTYGYFVRETNPRQQLAEILGRFKLVDKIQPLSRCIRCNGELKPVPKADLVARLEPKTREHYDEFSVCPQCDQLYWKGSHYEQMRRFISEVLEQNKSA